eukprot:m.63740 g.63740  ORF g.63740 m.63740 type:complete len:100 (+) comp13977_c0_seq2:88-387(+)
MPGPAPLLPKLALTATMIPHADLFNPYVSIAPEDIIDTMQILNLVKYWKGAKLICITPRLLDEVFATGKFKAPRLPVDERCLRWNPPVIARPATTDQAS